MDPGTLESTSGLGTGCPFRNTILCGKEIQTHRRQNGYVHWQPIEIPSDLELQPLPDISCSNLVIENSLFNSALCELRIMIILNSKCQIFSTYFVFHTYLDEQQRGWTTVRCRGRLAEALWITDNHCCHAQVHWTSQDSAP